MNDGNNDEFSGGRRSTKRKCVYSLNMHVFMLCLCLSVCKSDKGTYRDREREKWWKKEENERARG